MTTVAGAILCGGASARFGSPKALAPFLGRPAILHLVEAMRRAGLVPVVAVTGAGGVAVEGLRELGLDDVVDDTALRPPGASGPLCGVVAALRALQRDVVFWPADCPVPPPALLAALAAEPGAVTVDHHPLCVRLTPRQLPAAEAMLTSGRTGVRDLVRQVQARALANATLTAHDPRLLSACCFNTEAERDEAERRARDAWALER